MSARKGIGEQNILLAAFVLILCIVGFVFVTGKISPALDTSNEAQAKVLANTIAISVNTLSGMDAGRVEKSMDLKDPLNVEVYDKNPPKKIMYVKVTYGEKGEYYEVPLLVSIDPVPKTKMSSVYVIKNPAGKVYIKDQLSATDLAPSGDVPCSQPSSAEIKSYIDQAAGADQELNALVKALIMKYSSFMQCENAKYYLNNGRIGLAGLRIEKAAELGVNPYDPQGNVKGGTRYLASLLKGFGDINDGRKQKELALAAYEWNPDEITSIKSEQDWKLYIPDEVRDRVDGIMSYYDKCYKPGVACRQGNECRVC